MDSASSMHMLNEKEKPPNLDDAFTIPTNSIKVVMKEPFTGDQSMAPTDHLCNMEATFSPFKISSISP
jgi:hypothetical protein